MNNKNSIHNVVINETFNKFLIKYNNYFHISIYYNSYNPILFTPVTGKIFVLPYLIYIFIFIHNFCIIIII